MSRPYAPPELVRYTLLEAVRMPGEPLTCSPTNSAAECSCDCCFDQTCTNVGNPIQTSCQNNTGSCTSAFTGQKCTAASDETQAACHG